MHLKRNYMPKTWPVPRKGTKYLVVPEHGFEKRVPFLIIVRNLMKLAQNKKEAKSILNTDKVRVNGKIIKEEAYPLALFDVLTLGEKNFRVILKNKKFNIQEISGEESDKKIAKIIGRKILKGKKQQINLSDGRNIITAEKLRIGDSVMINLSGHKIGKVIPLKEKAKALVTSGKHTSKEGSVDAINEKKRLGILNIGKEKLNVKLESLMAIE